MTFYLKYRPQKIEELDETSVRDSLAKIVASGKIPHAFLFSGPKGTGKTSAARILAKIINCEKKGKEPCNKCEQCVSITKGNNIDVLELDAASHRGIDDVRALREAVKLSPARAKKKVYIIDEAHMLTTEASNALLKTLEEPPTHVMFILATTNPEKLIETIRSRTVHIPFKKAETTEVVRSLQRVVKGEKIKIKSDALIIIAEASEGSFRDASKILEQMVLEKMSLKKEEIEEFIFQKEVLNIDKLIRLLIEKETSKVLNEIQKINKAGGTMEKMTEVLLTRLRSALLSKVGIVGEDIENLTQNELVYLIELFSKAFREISESPIEELPVEIAVIQWCKNKVKTQNLDVKTENENSAMLDSASENLVQTINPDVHKSASPQNRIKEMSDEIWREILLKVRPINTTVEALLRAAKPMFYDGKNLTLGVFYRFHKERLEENVNRRILEDVVAQVLGAPAKIICTLTEPPKKEMPKETPKASGVLTEGEDRDIMKIAEEIFGS